MVSELVGFVTSVSMNKTITVLIPIKAKDPEYRNETLRSKSVLVHDERQEAEIGDCVLVEGTRPQSRRKNWKLIRLLPLNSLKT